MPTMSRQEESTFNPEALFDKFKEYFDCKFNDTSYAKENLDLKELKKCCKLKSSTDQVTQLSSGSVANFSLSVYLRQDKICISQIREYRKNHWGHSRGWSIIDRKSEVKITDESKASCSSVQHLEKEAKGGLLSDQYKHVHVQAADDTTLKELEQGCDLFQFFPG